MYTQIQTKVASQHHKAVHRKLIKFTRVFEVDF